MIFCLTVIIKFMNKNIIALMVILVLVGAFALAYIGNFNNGVTSPTATGTSPYGCMEEAMICPDGSYVERTGPNCDFAPCLSITPTTTPALSCPQLAPVGPNFCPNGVVVSGGLDANGCQLPPKCVVSQTMPKCVVGGCSGTLCGEEGEDLISTCEYREEYQCYKQAVCERQPTGKCGWTETSQFKACMLKFTN